MNKHYTPEEHQAWMKTLPSRPAGAGIVLKAPDGRALVVKATYKPYWTFPGGKVDDHEHPKATAIRETAEEVGIVVDESTVRFALTVSQKVDDVYSHYFLFEAAIDQQQISQIKLALDEIAESDFVDLSATDEDARTFSRVVAMYGQGQRGYGEFEIDLIDSN